MTHSNPWRAPRVSGVLTAAASLLAAGAALAAAAIDPHNRSSAPVTEPFNGPVIAEPTRHVLTGATVHAAPGRAIDNATVVIEDGRILSVRPGGPTPADLRGAQRHDYSGHHLYAGFIDPWIVVDAPEPDPASPGVHWCDRVTPQRDALAGDGLGESLAKSLRELGFAACAISPDSGVFRGQGAVVSTAAPPEHTGEPQPPVYKARAFHALGFDRSGWAEATYPTSVPGVVALMRQSLMDADWQATNTDRSPNALDALADRSTPLFFDTQHELMALLADDVAGEAQRPAVIVGTGAEFRILPALAEMDHAFILPLRYPARPDVTTPGKADSVSLAELMRWEQAPTNPRRLLAEGRTVALTTSKVTKRGQFHKNLAKAVEHGLSTDDALAALTTTPAAILGLADRLGTVEPGKIASLVVSAEPLGDKDFEPIDLWIDGRRHAISEAKSTLFDGVWAIRIGQFQMQAVIEGDTITNKEGEGDDLAESKARHVEIDGRRISWVIDDEDDNRGAYLVSGVLTAHTIKGVGVAPDQTPFQWTAQRIGPAPEDEADDDKDDDDETPDVPASFGFPFGPYARDGLPPQETLAVKGATVWTSGPEGIIDNALLIIDNGKVAYVGRALDPAAPAIPAGARVIDADGMHVTPGLVDAHSHTGLFRFGVNESGQAVTCEVRIRDSIDPAHINWYRQLAGGVTTVNTLHGSANPIGGQNAVSKVRWGSVSPAQMRLEGAPEGVKFALGENVKQSNWGDDNTTRYPQTRMGVETIIRDRLIAAQRYDGSRRDLELEALKEILDGERLIHCHSYRQDEILMLCRVAEDFGFKIGTFQHGLEVYKVAEVVREHAIGASLFSDWWAFKVEVQDAIPYAGPIQHEAGVNTSYNSDSDELARRMNGEAAKAHKYGASSTTNGIDPAEALKFVTLNPAIQLGIEGRVGSLEPGKDADFVLWSGDPLSAFTRCEETYIDGRRYFSREQDAIDRKTIARERSRLIQKVVAKAPAKNGADAKGDEPEGETRELIDPGQGLHRTARATLREFFIEQLRQGIDPTLPTCGDCGCGVIHLGTLLNR